MQPEQITNRRGEGVLEVLWEDGERQQATHRQLRAACKCSHCQWAWSRAPAGPQHRPPLAQRAKIAGNAT
ncbi:gamma-butyrobetaine hydroxylase-like domain-containing protein [Massilia sp. TSP1-1-2]|uniref:gamma-butyrobetaine hydroxylase-like domain-containing protein n=1 Tax=Massilia sp. TSP1-1-2 TaxID=2804649 RepID=UPI003CF4D370